MIYLDSVLCVYAIESTTWRGDRTKAVLRDDQAYCVSQLVLMECLVQPLKAANLALEERYRRYLGGMTMIDITPEVFERAAHVRASTGLKTADALHLAAALAGGCDAVWTADAEFAKRSGGYAIDVLADA